MENRPRALPLSYYEDENTIIDLRSNDIRITFKYRYNYSTKSFNETLLTIEAIMNGINKFNNQAERLTPRDV